jgi:tetratricopeptide (TPR) repeat protein
MPVIHVLRSFRARSLQRRARALLTRGAYAEALPLCQRVVALVPRSASGWSMLARALRGARRFDEAISACDSALALNSRAALGWEVRGKALADLGRYDEALVAFDHLCALIPPRSRALRTLAEEQRLVPLLKLKRFDQALAAADALLTLRPQHAALWVRRGEACAGLKRASEAQASFARAAELDPTSSLALTHLCQHYYNAHEYDKALAATEQLLALRPQQSSLWKFKGDTLLKRKSYLDARNAYEQALAVGALPAQDRQKLWNNYGITLIYTGRYGDALVAFDSAEAAIPGRAATTVNRGLIFSRLGRFADALDFFDAAHQANPTQVTVLTNLAFTLVCLGRTEQAQATLEAAFAQDMYNGYAWGAKGMLESLLGHDTVALAAFANAIALQPLYAPISATFALHLLVMNDVEQACQMAERAVTLDPYDARSWKAKALALQAAGQAEEAAEVEQRGTALLAEQQAQVDAYLRSRAEGSE